MGGGSASERSLYLSSWPTKGEDVKKLLTISYPVKLDKRDDNAQALKGNLEH
jgi:hypothetical protein